MINTTFVEQSTDSDMKSISLSSNNFSWINKNSCHWRIRNMTPAQQGWKVHFLILQQRPRPVMRPYSIQNSWTIELFPIIRRQVLVLNSPWETSMSTQWRDLCWQRKSWELFVLTISSSLPPTLLPAPDCNKVAEFAVLLPPASPPPPSTFPLSKQRGLSLEPLICKTWTGTFYNGWIIIHFPCWSKLDYKLH